MSRKHPKQRGSAITSALVVSGVVAAVGAASMQMATNARRSAASDNLNQPNGTRKGDIIAPYKMPDGRILYSNRAAVNNGGPGGTFTDTGVVDQNEDDQAEQVECTRANPQAVWCFSPGFDAASRKTPDEPVATFTYKGCDPRGFSSPAAQAEVIQKGVTLGSAFCNQIIANVEFTGTTPNKLGLDVFSKTTVPLRGDDFAYLNAISTNAKTFGATARLAFDSNTADTFKTPSCTLSASPNPIQTFSARPNSCNFPHDDGSTYKAYQNAEATARQRYEDARRDYENARDDHESCEPSKQDCDALRRRRDDAERAYENAQRNANNATVASAGGYCNNGQSGSGLPMCTTLTAVLVQPEPFNVPGSATRLVIFGNKGFKNPSTGQVDPQILEIRPSQKPNGLSTQAGACIDNGLMHRAGTPPSQTFTAFAEGPTGRNFCNVTVRAECRPMPDFERSVTNGRYYKWGGTDLRLAFPERCNYWELCGNDGACGPRCNKENPFDPLFCGCFAPEARILMADGTTRQAMELKVGDLVWNSVRRKGMRVKERSVGTEAFPLIKIGYGGKFTLVSQGHPMITRDGIKAAYEVTRNDYILGTDRRYHRVETLEERPPRANQVVYNIALDTPSKAPEDHMILADGIITGDLYLQRSLGRKASTP